MAQNLAEGATPPKIIRIYHDAGKKRAIIGSIWMEDVPGALAEAAASLAKVGINLVGSSTSSISGTNLAEWGFFAELDDPNITPERIREAVRDAAHVVRFDFKEGDSGVVVDTFHYPLQMTTGQPVMVLPRETFAGMLARVREVYGSGGSVIVYQLGVATGENDGKELVRQLGEDRVMQDLPGLVNLYLAQGWGIPELVDLSFNPLSTTIRFKDNFECQGSKIRRPSSHFLRGHLVGLGWALFKTEVECFETKCIAAGDDYCELIVSEVSPRPESGPFATDRPPYSR